MYRHVQSCTLVCTETTHCMHYGRTALRTYCYTTDVLPAKSKTCLNAGRIGARWHDVWLTWGGYSSIFVKNRSAPNVCVCELGTDVWLTWLFSVKIDRLNCVCVSSGRAAYVLYWIGTGYVSEPSFFSEPEPSPKFLEPPKLKAFSRSMDDH